MTHTPELTREQRYYQENKERYRINKRRYRNRNRAHVRRQAAEGERRRYSSDPQVRIKSTMRSRQNNVLRGEAGKRAIERFESEVGCSVAEFREHLSKQFSDGMNWDNRGRHGWHIDHKRPLSSFDLTDPQQLKAAYHYTNTQPMWANDNRMKMTS